MPRFAVTPLLAGALVLPLATPALATATGPVGAEVELVTAGLAFGDFRYPVVAGKSVTIQRHVLDPGEIVRWEAPGTTVAVNQTGVLVNYPSCKLQQTWRAFPAYYLVRSPQLGTLKGVTANQGEAPVELITITSEALGQPQSDAQLHRHSGNEVPSVGDLGEGEDEDEYGPDNIVDPYKPADGCPSGAMAETTTLADGVMADSQNLDLIDHNQIAVYRHTLPAGYNSGWYSPFDPTFILPVRGEISASFSCADTATHAPGSGFAAAPPLLVRNPGTSPAEYLSVTWNVQNGFPVREPLYVPELPPTDCLESPLSSGETS